MRNLLLVAELDRLEQDHAGIPRLLLIVVALFHNAIEQLSAHHLLGNQIVIIALLKDIVEPDNVRMLEIFQDRNLILQCYLILVRQFRLGDNLDGVGTSILLVSSLLDDRKGSGSELALAEVRFIPSLQQQSLHNDASTYLFPELVHIRELVASRRRAAAVDGDDNLRRRQE